MKNLKVLVGIGIIVIIGIAMFGYNISVDNRIVSLQNLYTKQTAAVETFHDKMWKTIQSMSQVTDKQKDAFKEIYVGIMQGRYSGGSKDGSLMKWIKEDNPQFDQSSYLKLMTAIESQREGFFAQQDLIQATVKEHNDMLRQAPMSWFVDSGVKPLEFVPISSTKSKAVMDSRKDDELHL